MQESKSCALPLGDSPIKKGGYRDSNPGPPEPQSGALTNCAIPTILYEFVCKLFALAAPATSLQNICSSSAEGLPPHHLCAEMKNVLGGIRTPDPRLRRPLLYPAELQTHTASSLELSSSKPCSCSLSVSRERVMGIEPTYLAWKASVLPLNYTRIQSG